MKAIILDKLKSDFILNIDELFKVMNEKQLNYNWLITNLDCSQEFLDSFSDYKDFIWISGKEFTEFLGHNTVQFIWAVISGFEKNIELTDILKYPLPYADGNTKLWNTNICIQNPLSEIEIIAWDSSLVIVISKDDEIIDVIKRNYPNAKDLLEYNKR